MSPELYEELTGALRNNEGQLGMVFALIEEGKTTNREFVEGGAAIGMALPNWGRHVSLLSCMGPTQSQPQTAYLTN